MLETKDILETINMIDNENLDVRTITMGISLLDCIDDDIDKACTKVYDKICRSAKDLVKTGEDIQREYGIPIINKRISVTPIAMVAAPCQSKKVVKFAHALDKAAKELGVNFIGGYSALVQKGFASGDYALIESIPEALATTDFVCSSVNIGSTKAGINMDAVKMMGKTVVQTAQATADRDCIGAAKLVVFCNAPEDNPFMAGAFHGVGEADTVINVGVSGPGVVRAALAKGGEGKNIAEIADMVKKTAFKITRMGQLVAKEASKRLCVPFGIVDLSLAPTPAVGDSVAHILEEMGLEVCGCHGTTAALALLNDAVKKGGVMASSAANSEARLAANVSIAGAGRTTTCGLVCAEKDAHKSLAQERTLGIKEIKPTIMIIKAEPANFKAIGESGGFSRTFVLTRCRCPPTLLSSGFAPRNVSYKRINTCGSISPNFA